MFAIAFDLTVSDTREHHPKGVTQAYADVGVVLERHGFTHIQGSVHVCESEDLGNLFDAMSALKALPWLPPSVRDIRAFRIEQWSDFTARIKATS